MVVGSILKKVPVRSVFQPLSSKNSSTWQARELLLRLELYRDSVKALVGLSVLSLDNLSFLKKVSFVQSSIFLPCPFASASAKKWTQSREAKTLQSWPGRAKSFGKLNFALVI